MAIRHSKLSRNHCEKRDGVIGFLALDLPVNTAAGEAKTAIFTKGSFSDGAFPSLICSGSGASPQGSLSVTI